MTTLTITDPVGVSEIAERAGVERRTVHQWRFRHASFPAPAVVLALGPVWSWPDVERWLRETGRLAPACAD